MSQNITNVSDTSFEEDVINAGPTLVDFWAEWCGPCKMIAPILEEIAVDYNSKLKVVKINVDSNTEVPAKYGVRGIPTLILFKDGHASATRVGALTKAQLIEFLDHNL
jgi:thioredoxin 1